MGLCSHASRNVTGAPLPVVPKLVMKTRYLHFQGEVWSSFQRGSQSVALFSYFTTFSKNVLACKGGTPLLSDDTYHYPTGRTGKSPCKNKFTKDGFIFCKICKGMYGLPHAGLIAQQLLEKGWKSMATARVTNLQVFGSMIPGLSALP